MTKRIIYGKKRINFLRNFIDLISKCLQFLWQHIHCKLNKGLFPTKWVESLFQFNFLETLHLQNKKILVMDLLPNSKILNNFPIKALEFA